MCYRSDDSLLQKRLSSSCKQSNLQRSDRVFCENVFLQANFRRVHFLSESSGIFTQVWSCNMPLLTVSCSIKRTALIMSSGLRVVPLPYFFFSARLLIPCFQYQLLAFKGTFLLLPGSLLLKIHAQMTKEVVHCIPCVSEVVVTLAVVAVHAGTTVAGRKVVQMTWTSCFSSE